MDNIFINNACKPGKFIWTNDSEKEAQLCNIVSTSAYFIKYFGMSKQNEPTFEISNVFMNSIGGGNCGVVSETGSDPIITITVDDVLGGTVTLTNNRYQRLDISKKIFDTRLFSLNTSVCKNEPPVPAAAPFDFTLEIDNNLHKANTLADDEDFSQVFFTFTGPTK